LLFILKKVSVLAPFRYRNRFKSIVLAPESYKSKRYPTLLITYSCVNHRCVFPLNLPPLTTPPRIPPQVFSIPSPLPVDEDAFLFFFVSHVPENRVSRTQRGRRWNCDSGLLFSLYLKRSATHLERAEVVAEMTEVAEVTDGVIALCRKRGRVHPGIMWGFFVQREWGLMRRFLTFSFRPLWAHLSSFRTNRGFYSMISFANGSSLSITSMHTAFSPRHRRCMAATLREGGIGESGGGFLCFMFSKYCSLFRFLSLQLSNHLRQENLLELVFELVVIKTGFFFERVIDQTKEDWIGLFTSKTVRGWERLNVVL